MCLLKIQGVLSVGSHWVLRLSTIPPPLNNGIGCIPQNVLHKNRFLFHFCNSDMSLPLHQVFVCACLCVSVKCVNVYL
jgi:hypothetical protein